MDIGIVGAGNIGGVLATRLTALGHQVDVANSRGPETLRDLERESGARAVPVTEAALGKQLLIVTIPEVRVPDLPDDLLRGAPDDIVVVDTGNYYPRERDGRIDAIEDGMPESAWVQQQLGRPVVKAFNSIYFGSLRDGGRPAGTEGRIALPVASDDDAAKRVVMDLIDALGFDAVDAGTIADSWRYQPGSPVYVADLDEQRLRDGLAEAQPGRPEAFAATEASPGTFDAPA